MHHSDRYLLRKYYIAAIMVAVALVYLLRLFYVQILSPEYKAEADNIAFFRKTLYPSRGMIYDCNDSLVVYNKPMTNVMVITRELAPFDTTDLCNILNIPPEYIDTKLAEIKDRKRNRGYSPYTPQLFLSQVSTLESGLLQEKLYKFPGFYLQHRTTRDYKYPAAALVLGITGEVNQDDIDKDPYYQPGDYSGRTGIERSYERLLRGEKGVSVLLRDAFGRVVSQYEEGRYDKPTTSGHDLKLSIDIGLQEFGERLMQGKRGAIVMIEPKSGEIRCLVSSPSYDPALLTGRDRGTNYKALEAHPHKPLFNRAIMGTYPPGSTFKPAQGLVFLQEHAIEPTTLFSCYHGYPLLGGRPACHGHPSPLALAPALATSCNAYFCWGLRSLLDDRQKYPTIQEAFSGWRSHMAQLGFGYRLGVDIPGEGRGFIPTSDMYDRTYGNNWTSSNIISISIGQGEITVTPIQMANFGAIIANRGYYYTPHLVREVIGLPRDTLHIRRHESGIESRHFDVIDQGMAAAVTGGTCRRANIPGITVCGKTGTAENPQGKDHSAFLGYAPRENPRIVVFVYVEHGGFGATHGVPIGRLMIEYYLRRELSTESKLIEQAMLHSDIISTLPPL